LTSVNITAMPIGNKNVLEHLRAILAREAKVLAAVHICSPFAHALPDTTPPITQNNLLFVEMLAIGASNVESAF
jgi:hypothetical protein